MRVFSSHLVIMKESFSVHLLSNVSPDLFPNNSPSKFSTYLANEINLPEGEWEVGVRQIMYPTHVATTSMDDKIDVYQYVKSYRKQLPDPSPEKIDLRTFDANMSMNEKEPLPATSELDSVTDFVIQQVKSSVQTQDMARRFEKTPIASFSIDTKKQLRKPTDLIAKLNEKSKTYQYKFHFDKIQQRFTLTLGSEYGLHLNKSLASILGFEFDPNLIYDPNTKVTAPEFPVLNRGITALYVYTNIIQSVYIGDVQAPLLLTCPFKNKDSKDDVHQLEFLNPYYVPLNRSVVNQIDIAIYDDSGSLIPFLYGKTKLSLDFRRKS